MSDQPHPDAVSSPVEGVEARAQERLAAFDDPLVRDLLQSVQTLSAQVADLQLNLDASIRMRTRQFMDSASERKELRAALAQANKDVQHLLDTCVPVQELTDVQAALAQALQAQKEAEQQLVYIWKRTGGCPCGARQETPNTHPHMLGCPTAKALDQCLALTQQDREQHTSDCEMR